MKKQITQTKSFSKKIDEYITKRRLLIEDFKAFKDELCKNPSIGDLIPGTGGIRKTRLKSTTTGKSGGFRVCYFDNEKDSEIFLILIYPKNEQDNLTSEQKKFLKELTNEIKKK
jgi:hypothetical protein